jgi:hypothetical protein
VGAKAPHADESTATHRFVPSFSPRAEPKRLSSRMTEEAGVDPPQVITGTPA